MTNEMFGLNALTTVNIPDKSMMFDRYHDLNVTNLRFPGGSVTEWHFDISDISGGSLDKKITSFQGNERTLTPFTNFIEFASDVDTSVTLVVPTINGFTQSAGEALLARTYGQRSINAEHIENVSEFIQAAFETARANGVRVEAFEIGNEFWGSGQMTASEYSGLAAAISQVISDTFTDLGISDEEQPNIIVQTISSAGYYSPSSDTTLRVDETTGFVYAPHQIEQLDDEFVAGLTEIVVASQGRSREQVREIMAAFDQDSVTVVDTQGKFSKFGTQDAANVIDGITNHYYVDRGFGGVNTEEQFRFNQLQIWNMELASRDTGLSDLEFYITEWNTRKNGDLEVANNRGLQQVAMNQEIFFEMVTHGVKAANFWPAIFNYSNSGTLIFNSAESLSLVGEGFALMSESLVGRTPVLDFRVAGEFAVHGYGTKDSLVYFFSERSGSQNRMELNLSDTITFDAEYYRVSWTELWDGGAGGGDEMAQPVITTTVITDLMTAEAFENFHLAMQAWSVVRMDIQGVDAADVGSIVPDGKGPHARLVRGSDADDRLYGGRGDDTIRSGAGNDTLTGGDGSDSFIGSLSELDGNTITDFSAYDRVLVTDSVFDVSALRWRGDTSILDIDANADGIADASITLEGELNADRFIVGNNGKNTKIRHLAEDDGDGSETGTRAESNTDDTTDITSDGTGKVQVLDRAGNGLDGTTVTFTPHGNEAMSFTTDAAGFLDFTAGSGQAGHLDARRDYNPLTDERISVGDALDVLRLAVEQAPSWGQAKPLDFIAADINRDGEVTVGDALTILRLAVGVDSEYQPAWIFLDSDADLTDVDGNNTTLDTGIQIEASEMGLTDMAMTGILLGNVHDHV